MIPVTLDDIAATVGGTCTGDGSATADGITIDSRGVRPGDLFVALPGERVDGHDFAADAVAGGAVAALTARPVTGVACVVVTDVVVALARLAGSQRSRLGALVVGITGSTGKTSTKDLVAQVLATAGETVAPQGSYNNEIGLPLTVLQAGATTRFLVLEMSARGVGHIRALCAVAPPDVAVVLNVGVAHLGVFGSREAIAAAKGEIIEGLGPGDLAVLNADDAVVSAMATRTGAAVVRFGLDPAADYRAEAVSLDESGRASFTLVTPRGRAPVTLAVHGGHQVGNALAAAAVAAHAGLDVTETAAALAAATPRSRWRMEVRETPEGVTVINDAYNANPDSMRAALEALAATGADRRTWAVVGPMAELGDATAEEHRRVGRLAAELDVDRLVVVGDEAGAVLDGWVGDAHHVADVDAAVALLRAALRPGDVVLVKASRSAGLERVALALTPDRSEVAR